MTRKEAKELFRNDKDAYGKPKKIMTKIDKIYDDFENMNCGSCKYYRSSCGICENLNLVEHISEDFGCNNWKSK